MILKLTGFASQCTSIARCVVSPPSQRSLEVLERDTDLPRPLEVLVMLPGYEETLWSCEESDRPQTICTSISVHLLFSTVYFIYTSDERKYNTAPPNPICVCFCWIFIWWFFYFLFTLLIEELIKSGSEENVSHKLLVSLFWWILGHMFVVVENLFDLIAGSWQLMFAIELGVQSLFDLNNIIVGENVWG